MIEINLLPKEYRKKQVSFSLGKSGYYVMGAAAAVVLMLFAVTFYQMGQLRSLDSNIAKARQRAAMLEKDIKLVDALTDVKDKITQRMRAVERLDSHRSAWVRILEDVTKNVPDFIWLGRFEEKVPKPLPADKTALANKNAASTQTTAAGASAEPTVRQVELEGYAFTLNALAAFMIKMMRSDYFEEVELVSTNEIKLEEQKAYNFVLTCNLHYLSDEELRNMIGNSKDEEASPDSKTSHASLN